MRQRTGVLRWFFLAGFLLGILLGNLAGGERLEDAGIFSVYFIKQCKYREISYDGILLYLLEKRGIVLFFLVCMGFSIAGVFLFRAYALWTGFAFGLMYTASVMNFGLKGLLLVTGAAFPHYIVYVYVFMRFYGRIERKKQIEQGQRGHGKGEIILLVLLFLAGILMEGILNTWILQKILKIF